ncbi:imm11 family protein [Paenibacillus oleatilyticus]|uniref:imm11 family protein n=1 Tax=Paenibacillus oleatilyticus TaxID=2594886 RepID=UPI001C1F555C|nr:DUF1629 domain-containing protein [Paenibacillus oleatilyticus]MBU7314292.1 hypothetical protein [Paenibacillus oleatilyticus]
MEYYILAQDERITEFEEPAGIAKSVDQRMLRNEEGRAALEHTILQFYTQGKGEYIDFIDRPIPLVSDALKAIFERYQPNVYYKLVVLADVKAMKQSLYWIAVPETVNGLSEESEWNRNDTLKRPMLEPNRLGHYKIFRIAERLEDFIVVDLDVAESILRYDLKGITLKKIDVRGM